VIDGANITAADEQAVQELFERRPGFLAAAEQLNGAIEAPAEEYGTAYARSVLKSSEALEAVYEQLGGDQTFKAEGESLRIRAGVLGSGRRQNGV
jgi:hypothetical protein